MGFLTLRSWKAGGVAVTAIVTTRVTAQAAQSAAQRKVVSKTFLNKSLPSSENCSSGCPERAAFFVLEAVEIPSFFFRGLFSLKPVRQRNGRLVAVDTDSFTAIKYWINIF
jgi:hypothetical protein